MEGKPPVPRTQTLSLAATRDALLELPHPFARQAVQEVVSRLDPAGAELAPYLNFAATSYTRTLFYRGPRFEMLVLCWRDGQASPIHDHAASICSMAVLQGVCQSETFSLADGRAPCGTEPGEQVRLQPGPVEVYETGSVVTVVGGDIHRVGNGKGSGTDLVTVHFYLPPITAMRCFDAQTGRCRIVEPESLSPRC
jgi:cysteine dioxygenase